MIKDRNIIILMASVTTGITINRSWECIEYYGGKLQEFQQYLVRFLNMVIFLLMRCLLQMIFLPIIHIANTTAHIAKMDKNRCACKRTWIFRIIITTNFVDFV